MQYKILLLGLGLLVFFIGSFSISRVPKDKVGMYYNIYTGAITTQQQGLVWRPFFSFIYRPWYNRVQEQNTNLVDIRSYADPIVQYPILTEAQLKLYITGKAMVKIVDPVKAFQSTNDLDNTIDSLCKAELRNFFSKLTAKEIIQRQDHIEQQLTSALNQDLMDHGTLVERFIIGHVHLPSALTKSVELTTAKEAEHRCKLLEIHNQKQLAEEQLKIQESKQRAELEYKERKLDLERKEVELSYRVKLEYLEELKKKGVNLTEYLKYEDLKDSRATMIVTNATEAEIKAIVPPSAAMNVEKTNPGQKVEITNKVG